MVSGSGKRNEPSLIVLVVDDYADTRLVVKWALEMRGFRVIEAASGEEALGLAKKQRPDVVLMDLNMPVMDGFSTMRLMREDSELNLVPIVAVTAQDQALSRDRAREAGCTEYISKPIDFERLDVLINRLVPAL